MKNKFILYAIAILFLFNLIFQFLQLSKIKEIGMASDSGLKINSSALSSFRRHQDKIISEMKDEIMVIRTENEKLRAQLKLLEIRIQSPER